MACRGMYMWSLSGLVGAFLDLGIAYFLLCASTIAFLASKFLAFFGLCLPCPCNGLFGCCSNSNYCLQRLLVDFPVKKVSGVELSAKENFPFNDWGKDPKYNTDSGVVQERNNDANGFVEVQGEASCSSISDARKSVNIARRELNPRNESMVGRDRFHMKGKGTVNQRPRGGLRRRRKANVDYGKPSSISSYDPACSEVEGGPASRSSMNEGTNNLIGDSTMPVDNGGASHHFDYDGQTSIAMGRGKRSNFELNYFHDENKHTKKSFSLLEELKFNVWEELGSSVEERNAIKLLEQALEEEQAARAALYIELEKERSAAATAADEAMAMILRLQEEKASIEMEARQYQRIIEEKSAYDAEELNILKEILVRREREKLFLEKKVQAYEQMICLGNEDVAGNVDMADPQGDPEFVRDPKEDPILMLHQLSASIGQKEKVKCRSLYGVISTGMQDCTLAAGKNSPIQGQEDIGFKKQEDQTGNFSLVPLCSYDDKQELQEKKMVYFETTICTPSSDGKVTEGFFQSYEPASSGGHHFHGKDIPQMGGELKRDVNLTCQSRVTKDVETSNGTDIVIPHCEHDLGQDRKGGHKGIEDSRNKEPRLHDVHVIINESNSSVEVNSSEIEQLLVNDNPEVLRKDDLHSLTCLSRSSLNTNMEIKRSSSDITCGFPPLGPRERSLPILQRNSMSAVNSERLKIDNEVESLRERLKVVQEGREKLNISAENLEKEKMQIKLLENIARQLQEIRKLTECGKALRQASLPPPSSKVMSKKRRSRSVSLGVHKSS